MRISQAVDFVDERPGMTIVTFKNGFRAAYTPDSSQQSLALIEAQVVHSPGSGRKRRQRYLVEFQHSKSVKGVPGSECHALVVALEGDSMQVQAYLMDKVERVLKGVPWVLV